MFTTYGADTSGRLMVATQVLEAISRTANAPVFGFVDSDLGAGMVGGELVQTDVLAQRAAVLAARILKGEAPESIPPWKGEANAVKFDARQLKRWRISESRLPPGSTVMYRERTLWTEYRWQALAALGVLLAQALLIGGLVAQRRQRRRAQASLVEAEHRYRTVADFATDWEYWMRTDGSLLFVSPSCERVTGYDAAAFLSRPELLNDLVLDEDRDSWRQHRSSVRGLPAPSSLQFRIRTRDGETRWIEHVCSGVTGPDGSDQGRRASNRDITERKQAEEDLRRALREIE
jgi:PAS domain S-box-containing protein